MLHIVTLVTDGAPWEHSINFIHHRVNMSGQKAKDEAFMPYYKCHKTSFIYSAYIFHGIFTCFHCTESECEISYMSSSLPDYLNI